MVGHCNGTGMYSKQGTWDDCNIKFTLFRCHLANSERMWFISIVPDGIKPGTDEDKDFYVAPEIGQTKTPPEEGWVAIRPYGVQPAPVCLFDAPEPTKKAAIVSHEVLNIHSAGSEEVNGFYHRTGIFDNVGMYTRTAPWGVSTDTKLTIFRSVGSEGHRRWLLSTVPHGCSPGSHRDTDLYMADSVLLTNICVPEEKPPQSGWKAIPGFGLHPPVQCHIEKVLNTSQALGTLVNALSSDIQPSPQVHSSNRLESPKSAGEWIGVTDKSSSVKLKKVATCFVCRVRAVSHVFIPCGHPCLCNECATGEQFISLQGRCPIGRCQIHSVMRFYGTLVEDSISP